MRGGSTPLMPTNFWRPIQHTVQARNLILLSKCDIVTHIPFRIVNGSNPFGLHQYMSKQTKLKHERDYIEFLERRMSSSNFRKKSCPEDIDGIQNKIRKFRRVFKMSEWICPYSLMAEPWPLKSLDGVRFSIWTPFYNTRVVSSPRSLMVEQWPFKSLDGVQFSTGIPFL